MQIVYVSMFCLTLITRRTKETELRQKNEQKIVFHFTLWHGMDV
jgi:hypothetical protein